MWAPGSPSHALVEPALRLLTRRGILSSSEKSFLKTASFGGRPGPIRPVFLRLFALIPDAQSTIYSSSRTPRSIAAQVPVAKRPSPLPETRRPVFCTPVGAAGELPSMNGAVFGIAQQHHTRGSPHSCPKVRFEDPNTVCGPRHVVARNADLRRPESVAGMQGLAPELFDCVRVGDQNDAAGGADASSVPMRSAPHSCEG